MKYVVVVKRKYECDEYDLTPYQRLMPPDFPIRVKEIEYENDDPPEDYMTIAEFNAYMSQFPSFDKSKLDVKIKPWWKFWGKE